MKEKKRGVIIHAHQVLSAGKESEAAPVHGSGRFRPLELPRRAQRQESRGGGGVVAVQVQRVDHAQPPVQHQPHAAVVVGHPEVEALALQVASSTTSAPAPAPA